jgi:non-homologous end joining protein Ku
MKIIKAKLKGRKPDLEVEEEPQSAEVVDLMERLRQSLQSAGGAKKQAKSGTRKAASRGKKRKAA